MDDTQSAGAINLTAEHRKAVDRQRRIIFQDDVLANEPFRLPPEWWGIESAQSDRLGLPVDYYMARIDQKPNQIDSIWFEWGEGNTAVWPSGVLPCASNVFPKWWEIGVDPVKLLLDAARQRELEVFFSYRLNGSDNDSLLDEGYPGLNPVKAQHPDWLLQPFAPLPQFHWNFAVKKVRDYKLHVLREVAELYDFDGIQVDFARVPSIFPEGQQWKYRDLLTDFMRRLRLTLLAVESRRTRPLLLAVRIPENTLGCRFDGLDIERWSDEQLVDLLVLGCRSSDVSVEEFRTITVGTQIKLYPSWDEHHSSDGYHEAPIEVWRGVYANWWMQGADGAHTFNLIFPPPELQERFGLKCSWSPHSRERWDVQCRINREIGSSESLRYTDKTFFVQRRGGGHAPAVVPNPEDWHTPTHMYLNTNMFAPLPCALANDGKTDTLLTLKVADDVRTAGDRLSELSLRLALSDPAAERLPETERLERIAIERFARRTPDRCHWNTPPARGLQSQIEVRMNNILLGPAGVEGGWFVYPVRPSQLAVGDNLLGIRVRHRSPETKESIVVEKLELSVRYR